ncbi:15212_t:CDS:1, partial [Cetraspora pellucida]
YTDPMQAPNYYIIASIATMKFETNKEMNQVISIYRSDAYQANIHASVIQKQEYAYSFSIAKSRLKFVLENRLINKFIELITRFIEDYSSVVTNEHMTVDIFQIENSKKLKHKGHPRLYQNTLQDLNISQDLNLR